MERHTHGETYTKRDIHSEKYAPGRYVKGISLDSHGRSIITEGHTKQDTHNGTYRELYIQRDIYTKGHT